MLRQFYTLIKACYHDNSSVLDSLQNIFTYNSYNSHNRLKVNKDNKTAINIECLAWHFIKNLTYIYYFNNLLRFEL